MEDYDIVKIGVAPYTDKGHLKKDYNVHVASTLDLRFLARKAKCQHGGLKAMTERYTKLSIDETLTCSSWEASKLSEEQIEYAADDVRAAIELFKYFHEEIAPDESVRRFINNHCSQYINRNYGDNVHL